MTLLLALLLGCRWFAPEPAPVADEDVAAFARDMATRCAGLFVVEANGDTVLLVRDARIDIEPLHEQEMREGYYLDGVRLGLDQLEQKVLYHQVLDDWPRCVGLLAHPDVDRLSLARLTTVVHFYQLMPFIHVGPTAGADLVYVDTSPGTPYQAGGPPCPPVVAVQMNQEGGLHILPRPSREGNPDFEIFRNRPEPHLDVVLPGLAADAEEVVLPVVDGRFPLEETTAHLQRIIEHPEHVVVAIRMNDFATTRDLAAAAGAIAEATGSRLWLVPVGPSTWGGSWDASPRGSGNLRLEAPLRPFEMGSVRYSASPTACP